RRALDRRARHRARGARDRGAHHPRRLRHPGLDRQPAPRALPDPVRGRLDDPAGRGRRRGRARGPPPARGSGAVADGRELVPRPLGAPLRDRGRRRAHPAQPAGDPALPRADAERGQPRPRRLRQGEREPGRPGAGAGRDGGGGVRGRGRARAHRGDVPPPSAAQRRRDAGASRLSATTFAWLLLAFPLAGCVITALGWRALPGRAAGWIATAAIALSFAGSIGALADLLGRPGAERALTSSLYTYAAGGGLDVKLGILVDPLSVFMCLVVSGVSALIHLYSVAYLSSDRGYARFFSYLNFFVFSMLLLVLAGNLILLIVGWAFVGFASYALISFWYRRETATRAGMKAFVINVIGDVGLVLAAFFIFRDLGTFDYQGVFSKAPQTFHTNQGVVVAICLLLLVGAIAKSAQVPLHTWLPDAMEGPTPVSALIHAATMVTAGVYLIARMHPLFELAPTAADISAFIGLATLIFAATVALVMTDIKRVIAYSTMSQIGYMI